MSGPPLKVAVLVDLERRPDSGGHVKCWERLAEAACGLPGLDLTVHFQGAEARAVLAPNVRYRFLPAVLSTRRLRFLGEVPDHTDLAPCHRGLARELAATDVIHTTDAFFAYARTAERLARRAKLVTSLHTDTPGYTAIYAAATLRRLGAPGRLLVRAGLPERLAAGKRRRLDRHAALARHVLVGPGDLAAWRARLGNKVGVLRRGIDRSRFSPARRDRAWLAEAFGIPPGRSTLLFAGRLSPGKAVRILAEATRALLAQQRDVHAVFAGDGPERAAIAALLGDRAALPGAVSQETLARLYASADLFVFPSPVEVAPNAVVEAKASGLPVVVAPSGGGILVRAAGTDGVIVEDPAPEAWAAAIAALLDDPARRSRLSAAGLADVAAHHPAWSDVLREDLLPVWQAVASRGP